MKKIIKIPQLIRIGLPTKVKKQRHALSWLFAAVVGVILLAAIGLAMLAVWGLTALGVGGGEDEIGLGLILVLVGAISLILGTVLSFLLSKIPLRPINNFINCMNRLASEGMPFRDAYKKVGLDIEAGKFTHDKQVNHTHEGSIGNLCNDKIESLMKQVVEGFNFSAMEEAENSLLGK